MFIFYDRSIGREDPRAYSMGYDPASAEQGDFESGCGNAQLFRGALLIHALNVIKANDRSVFHGHLFQCVKQKLRAFPARALGFGAKPRVHTVLTDRRLISVREFLLPCTLRPAFHPSDVRQGGIADNFV